jgi:hypothetical protein
MRISITTYNVFFIFFTQCILLNAQDKNPLIAILSTGGPDISRVMDSLQEHELEVKYTHISRDAKGDPMFVIYDFQLDPSHYFYPASSVKLPVAVLALENFIGRKLKNGKPVDLDTPYKIEGDTLISSLRKDVEAIFAVSDNEAYNRLFELLGRDSISKDLRSKGIENVQIVHRLSTPNSSEAKTKNVIFNPESRETDSIKGYSSEAITVLKLEGIQKGKGYTRNDSLISGSFDFSEKNYFPICAQQEVLKRILFPQEYSKKQRFALSKKTHRFLVGAMHKMPRQLGYDEAHFQDGYGKFFMYGDSKSKIPKHVQIFNKVGYAYGTLTDNAYIKDTKNKIEFLLTATILVNKNGIFNDGVYEFENVGIPFLAELGRQVYKYELGLRIKSAKK